MLRRCLLLLVLPACADQKIDLGALDTPEDVVDACQEYTPETVTLEVLFPAQEDACPWGRDDNAVPRDGVFTARIEETETLDLPEDAVICDLAFDFSGLVPDEVQVMVYDDHFFFTFNDNVLASSYAPAVDALPTDGALRTWDWERVVGMDYHAIGEGAPYCLGGETGGGTCDIPATETPGPISLSFDEALVAELSLSAIQEGRYDFAFVTTGDDDPEKDCRHEAFGFTVEVPYLVP